MIHIFPEAVGEKFYGEKEWNSYHEFTEQLIITGRAWLPSTASLTMPQRRPPWNGDNCKGYGESEGKINQKSYLLEIEVIVGCSLFRFRMKKIMHGIFVRKVVTVKIKVKLQIMLNH